MKRSTIVALGGRQGGGVDNKMRYKEGVEESKESKESNMPVTSSTSVPMMLGSENNKNGDALYNPGQQLIHQLSPDTLHSSNVLHASNDAFMDGPPPPPSSEESNYIIDSHGNKITRLVHNVHNDNPPPFEKHPTLNSTKNIKLESAMVFGTARTINRTNNKKRMDRPLRRLHVTLDTKQTISVFANAKHAHEYHHARSTTTRAPLETISIREIMNLKVMNKKKSKAKLFTKWNRKGYELTLFDEKRSVWLLYPEKGSDFHTWLEEISQGMNTNLKFLYQCTGEDAFNIQPKQNAKERILNLNNISDDLRASLPSLLQVAKEHDAANQSAGNGSNGSNGNGSYGNGSNGYGSNGGNGSSNAFSPSKSNSGSNKLHGGFAAEEVKYNQDDSHIPDASAFNNSYNRTPSTSHATNVNNVNNDDPLLKRARELLSSISQLPPNQNADNINSDSNNSKSTAPSSVQKNSSNDAVPLSGYLYKQKSGLMKGWTKRYFALWNSRMMYYFHTEFQSESFFNQSNEDSATIGTSSTKARGQIDLATVASVRVSSKTSRSLPGSGKGIELHTPSRVWLLCPASEEEFVEWLKAISKIVSANVKRLCVLTGDDELKKEISTISMKKLKSATKTLLKKGTEFTPLERTNRKLLRSHNTSSYNGDDVENGEDGTKSLARSFSSSGNMMSSSLYDLNVEKGKKNNEKSNTHSYNSNDNNNGNSIDNSNGNSNDNSNGNSNDDSSNNTFNQSRVETGTDVLMKEHGLFVPSKIDVLELKVIYDVEDSDTEEEEEEEMDRTTGGTKRETKSATSETGQGTDSSVEVPKVNLSPSKKSTKKHGAFVPERIHDHEFQMTQLSNALYDAQTPTIKSSIVLTGLQAGELDNTGARILMAKQLGVDPSSILIISVGKGDNPNIDFKVIGAAGQTETQKKVLSDKIKAMGTAAGKAKFQTSLGELPTPITTPLGTITAPVPTTDANGTGTPPNSNPT